MRLFETYQKWLTQSGVRSASNYSTRLKRVIEEWDRHSKPALTPFVDKIVPVLFSNNSMDYIDNITFRLRKFADEAWKRDEYSKGYRNDIITAINRLGDCILSLQRVGVSSGLSDKNDVAGVTTTIVSESDEKRGRELLSQDFDFFNEFEISTLVSALVNRTRTRDSAFWPARKFSSVLPEKGKWVDQFIESLIIMTECGIHKISDISKCRIQDGILYVRPNIYQQNSQREKSKVKGVAQMSSDGFVKAYSYHADGTIHSFRIEYDKTGSPIPSISFEHTPAISLLISRGGYPEIENLINNISPNVNKLKEEMRDLVGHLTCVLMQRDQNVLKKDAW